jgi:hypothetical protein
MSAAKKTSAGTARNRENRCFAARSARYRTWSPWVTARLPNAPPAIASLIPLNLPKRREDNGILQYFVNHFAKRLKTVKFRKIPSGSPAFLS